VIDTVFINGTVGSGKTSTAEALSALEAAAEHPHAVIDADDLRRNWPAPPGDPFQQELELQNLRALAENYRAVGADRLIVAGVIERADDVARYAAALGTTSTGAARAGAARMLVCRLTADPRVLEARLRARHDNDQAGRDWHLHRAGELAGILQAADFDDLVIDSTAKTARQVAHEIAAAVGWAPAT
jgi:broad-specificity NMP kinase